MTERLPLLGVCLIGMHDTNTTHSQWTPVRYLTIASERSIRSFAILASTSSGSRAIPLRTESLPSSRTFSFLLLRTFPSEIPGHLGYRR